MSVAAWIPTGPDDAPLRPIDLDGGRTSINQRQLRRHGLAGWQATTTAALLTAWDLTSKPGVFLDVGANAGVYALLCRLLWPSIDAIAFEPSPTTIAAGRRWCAANHAEVRFEQVALSDTDGQGTLYLSSRSDASNSLVRGFRPASGTLETRLLRLDTYVARTGVAPTVVKVDVEQHEPAVIRGAETTLTQHRPVVVIELLDTEASQLAHRRLLELGYAPHDLGSRDRLYWPGGPPPGLQERLDGWSRAIARCTPPAARGPRPKLSSAVRRLRRARPDPSS